MESAEIRTRFLRHFADRGHTVVPSAPLPYPDPQLLLVNAGMVPFKPYFTGEQTPPYARATSVQKCVRTNDIEEVGRTTRHASFFQMAGNFSFGDYFKEGAIPFAWELLTGAVSDGGYGFDESKLWVTVYLDDDEAIDIWHRKVGVPLERIQRRGKADNYWSMGVAGPCGPCSEIYYDRGPDYGRDGGPIADEDRYLEVWNLVFMQFERADGGTKDEFPILGPLPKPNIDTGMGLERMATLLQGVENLYEIDTTMTILQRAEDLTGAHYRGSDAAAGHEADVRLRVIADHARTTAFLIGDDVVPGNEGRSYVLRRIMRRVVRNARLLGASDPVLAELVDSAITAMGPQYPELVARRERLLAVAAAEEASFRATLATGTKIVDVAVSTAKQGGIGQLDADTAFTLHDTYGFPIDLTLEMASEQGLTVDEPGFRRLMGEQRDRAKADAKSKKTGYGDLSVYRGVLDTFGPQTFLGYQSTRDDATVVGLLSSGGAVPAVGAGDEVEVLLDRTPFYAEGGGQLSDSGQLLLSDGSVVTVDEVQQVMPGVFAHRGRVACGGIVVGQRVEAVVDLTRRQAISRAHSATHMVHKAIREALGDSAYQMGSENSPGRLRFDFPAAGALPATVLTDVEQRVNEVLVDNLPITAEYMGQTDAVASGAMALFGEKYGDRVRVVSVGDWARELCGGTHMRATGELGVVKLLGESSVGAGVRRVEALVGPDAFGFLAAETVIVSRLLELVKGRREELPEKISGLLATVKEHERELEKLRAERLRAGLDQLLTSAVVLPSSTIWTFLAPEGTDAGGLRTLALDGRGRLAAAGRPVAVLGLAVTDGKVVVVAASTPDAVGVGLGARTVLAAAMPAVGGRGGGKDDVAQGSGSDPAGIGAAQAAVRALAEHP